MMATTILKDSGDWKPPKKETPTIPLDQEEIQVLGKGLEFIKGFLNSAIRRHGYDTLNKHFVEICDDLATSFNCIADPEYRKSWEERKEISL
jgi:hypothetical protein